MQHNLETRELMEEIFPLTDQVNLLSETSRYAYDSLITSQLFNNYGNAKSNANKSYSNTNINTTCNNTCSPLPSKRQRESLRRQTTQGTSHPGTLKSTPNLFNLSLTHQNLYTSKFTPNLNHLQANLM